jgi:hypothetical protein
MLSEGKAKRNADAWEMVAGVKSHPDFNIPK